MTTEPFTREKLRQDIAAMLEIDADALGDDDNLMDMGLDSMRAMNLVMQWDEEGVPVDFGDLAENMTLASLWSVVQERQG
ncbi:phosphopantetheine-binding protein [Altericroceibacterium spongiae]|uniref:Phosphopantetheine-binding protein n=1 Tax=Altericroceibacterium spongiae TaxID=2320269 RepID=A0A420EA78_9SPHN|nr:phosphopantetheine-binding protein [Altericroceibacterium spongiae]RKF17597.1 phosphopantetheine-binding protein [Altericroceibacterium spongiae]